MSVDERLVDSSANASGPRWRNQYRSCHKWRWKVFLMMVIMLCVLYF